MIYRHDLMLCEVVRYLRVACTYRNRFELGLQFIQRSVRLFQLFVKHFNLQMKRAKKMYVLSEKKRKARGEEE